MVNPKLSTCKPKAILPVQAILFADVSDPPEQATSNEVKQRLRNEAHLVQPRENEQTLVYGNTQGHALSDMLSVLRKEVEESRKERAEHKTILDRHEKQFEEYRANVDNHGIEIKEYRTTLDDHKRQIKEYRTTLDGHESQIKEYRTTIDDHKIQIEEYRTTIDDHENQIENLIAKVRDLTETSEGYLDIRTRFLDVYQRHRGNLNELQRKEIRKGNWRAHCGDAAADAKLYREARRSDGELFQELYGVQFEQVLNLTDEVYNGTVDGRVFYILDIHGTQMARGNRFPTELESAFTSYLSEVCKESEELASYKRSDQVYPYKSINDVAARARTFWNLYKQFQKSTQGMES